jgi:uncharacterized protein (DUF433 family)
VSNLIDPARYLRQDPREVPTYRLAEAAHYLQLPPATLRAWACGQANFKPVIEVPDQDTKPTLLSFLNLVELHVLGALRRQHQVPLPHVRSALRYLKRESPGSSRPLANVKLLTNGLDLFVERYGKLINATRDGQVEIRALLQAHLRRVDSDDRGVALRLYPFTHGRELDGPRSVVIDARVSFGRPTLAGTGIPTGIIAERFKAGESPAELAADYRRTEAEILEAIRCELSAEAAA